MTLKAHVSSLFLYYVDTFPRGSTRVYPVATTITLSYRFAACNSIFAMFQSFNFPWVQLKQFLIVLRVYELWLFIVRKTFFRADLGAFTRFLPHLVFFTFSKPVTSYLPCFRLLRFQKFSKSKCSFLHQPVNDTVVSTTI